MYYMYFLYEVNYLDEPSLYDCIITIWPHVFERERLSASLDQAPFYGTERSCGIGSGVASSIALALLRTLTFDPAALERHLPDCLPQIQEWLDCSPINLSEVPWVIFGAGVLCGLLAGPVLDVIWLLRQRWRRLILRHIVLERSSRSLHKVMS